MGEPSEPPERGDLGRARPRRIPSILAERSQRPQEVRNESLRAAIAGADVPYPGKLILQDGLEPLRARSAWTGSRRSGRWKAGPAGR